MVAYRGGRLQGHRKETASGQIARPHGLHHYYPYIFSQHSSSLVHWQRRPPARIRRQPDVSAFFGQIVANVREENYMDETSDHVTKEDEPFQRGYVCLYARKLFKIN